MQFKYSLAGAGWAEGFIEINSQKCVFSPSYLTDAFGDLLRSLIDLLNGEKSEIFLWDEEPRGLKWKLTLQDNKTLYLTITEYMDTAENIDEEEGVIVVNTTCSFHGFIKMVIKEAEQILLKYGIVGYHESWIEHEFPLSSYLQLKYFLVSKEKSLQQIIPKHVELSEDCKKSNLKQELQYLIQSLDL